MSDIGDRFDVYKVFYSPGSPKAKQPWGWCWEWGDFYLETGTRWSTEKDAKQNLLSFRRNFLDR